MSRVPPTHGCYPTGADTVGRRDPLDVAIPTVDGSLLSAVRQGLEGESVDRTWFGDGDYARESKGMDGAMDNGRGEAPMWHCSWRASRPGVVLEAKRWREIVVDPFDFG